MSRLILLAAAACFVFAVASAQDAEAPEPATAPVGAGDISLSPKRITLDSSARATAVYVFNRGTTTATYSISLVDRVMTPDGRILTIEDAMKDPADAAIVETLQSASRLITHTPRRVTLQPNESQTVRILAQRPANLPAGEYRTHLTVTAIPPADYGLTAEQAAGVVNEGELSIRLLPLFSLSIPLIVRQGPTDVSAAIESARMSLEPPMQTSPGQSPAAVPTVSLDLLRLGSSSLYGNIEIYDGDEVIGRSAGLAVYPEVERRAVTVALRSTPRSGATLTVVFIDQDSRPGDELAKTELIAP
jgi:P pilus assembly chaperone PapD